MHTSMRLGVICALVLSPLTAQSLLTTTFAGGNSLNSPGSNQFDITVLNPHGIVITGLDVNCENSRNGPVGSPFDIDVYITDVGGTYVGNQTNPAVWHQISHGSGVSAAVSTPTPVDVDDFFLPPGHYGMALQYVIPAPSLGTAFTYSNGPLGPYSNADLQLDLGSSCSGLFTGPVYNPRVWNGTVYYEAGRTAAFGVYGTGCDGGSPTGAPWLRPGAANPVPRLGGIFDLDVGNLGPVPCGAVMVFGLSVSQWGPFPLPLDMSMFGMPGCSGYVSIDATAFFANVGLGAVTYTVGIPNNMSLAGLAMGNQALILDPTATNAVGVNATNLAAGRIGL